MYVNMGEYCSFHIIRRVPPGYMNNQYLCPCFCTDRISIHQDVYETLFSQGVLAHIPVCNWLPANDGCLLLG